MKTKNKYFLEVITMIITILVLSILKNYMKGWYSDGKRNRYFERKNKCFAYNNSYIDRGFVYIFKIYRFKNKENRKRTHKGKAKVKKMWMGTRSSR